MQQVDNEIVRSLRLINDVTKGNTITQILIKSVIGENVTNTPTNAQFTNIEVI